MMNQHMAAGQPGQQSMPMHHPHHHQHHQSRRQQEYHAYAHQAFPHPQAQPFSPSTQQPIHHNPYAQYHPQHPAFYAQPQSPYIQPRYPHPQQWMQPHHGHYGQPPSHFMPPQQQQMQFQPRSPMVVSSQPMGQPMTPSSRPMQMQAPTMNATVIQPAQSPMSIPHVQQQPPYAISPSPVAKQLDLQQEPSPAPSTSSLKQVASPPPELPRRQSTVVTPLSLPPEYRTPFYPQLPWYSTSDPASFPPRELSRRKRRQSLRKPNDTLALPSRDQQLHLDGPALEAQSLAVEEPGSDTSTIAARSDAEAAETPATSQAPSEVDFAQQLTPTTPAQSHDSAKPISTPTHTRRDTRTSIAVPNIPGLRPKVASLARPEQPAHQIDLVSGQASKETETHLSATENGSAASVQTSDQVEMPIAGLQIPAKPKSWADLVRKNAPKTAQSGPTNGIVATNGVAITQSTSLAESLSKYNVDSDNNVSFIEPRGLVNTGNMCYMNSILQVLVFCVPFYTLLDQVRQRTSHSINSETPLLDAMIMFMQEFQILETRPTAQQLRTSMNQQMLEQFGEPLIPEYVYDVTRKLPTFAHMRRGHQQDAEEFLGFLLEALHEECVKVMQVAPKTVSQNGAASPTNPITPQGTGDGWLEVGPKQKASTTRTSGDGDSSPITKIFGGNLRSELRVPGIKDSVTLEPYKPLQLDIGAPHVNNIVDALKGITRTETLMGDFGGRGNQAKKQVFIDTVPPVLILHLKRFEYVNNLTGTQKIWKKVGYPLELELPKEIFPPAKRSNMTLNTGGIPKYRLISVVYHHGKSAAGGHYTVDVLRQDSREWLRLDDTILRRVRAEDVAAAGAEEDPKVLAKALEAHKAQASVKRNLFDGLDDDNDSQTDDTPWSEVNGHNTKDKKGPAGAWAGVAATSANGTGTSTPKTDAGKKTPRANASGVKENKVAYILLYERIKE